MDDSLNQICDALKKIFGQLKPQNNPVSFIIITGKRGQGTSTLLQQSNLQLYAFKNDSNIKLYHNQYGVILDLSESWLIQSTTLLNTTLKKLNNCHRHVKISGIILCIDLTSLCTPDADSILAICDTHINFLKQFTLNLGHLDLAIIFTKTDRITGFCEYFQQDHVSNFEQPFGFSLKGTNLSKHYSEQFDQFIESMGQSMVEKVHAIRTSIKRTLIREFPLQLSSLKPVILRLLQRIPAKNFSIHAIYFVSSQQGGALIDKLHTKIQNEYALTIQKSSPQSTNYRTYFIEGALIAFQKQTARSVPITLRSYQWLLAAIIGGSVGLFIWIGHHYIYSSHLLDNASKELIAYEALKNQQNQTSAATYHLTHATMALETLTSHAIVPKGIKHLKSQLQHESTQQFNQHLIPQLLADIEHVITDPHASHMERYTALKIYLMLAQPQHFSRDAVLNWYIGYWSQNTPKEQLHKKITLLKQVFNKPQQKIAINEQIVKDTRNYLNALPANYLYYSLTKTHFNQKPIYITVDGFNLPAQSIPKFVTHQGFNQVIKKLPGIIKQLQAENWVLARQDLDELPILIQQAYCYEYVVWWQHFMLHIKPEHAQTYQQAHTLVQKIHQTNAISHLVNIIIQHTGPISGANAGLFNSEIASKFTELSLMSQSSIKQLSSTLTEFGRFLRTLSIVHDQGKTAFFFTKSRFQGESFSNPLNSLYHQSAHLPEPLASWTKQIADDSWFLLISDSREYINHQWQSKVYPDYQSNIANRFPLDNTEAQEISLNDFNKFFMTNGLLNSFINEYLKPFLDTSQPQWQLKTVNGYVMPISSDMINELIRANVITNMFFPHKSSTSQIDFSLQKLSLDPIVSMLQIYIGDTKLTDTQDSNSYTQFSWPQNNAKLKLKSIEGNNFELEEQGPWAFFKILQKVNVLVDEENSSHLQILFEINGNSGRYLLKTENEINPFIPGILNGFNLSETIV